MSTIDELEIRDLLIIFLKRSWILVIAVGISGYLARRSAAKMPDLYSSTALLVPAAGAATGGSSVTLGSATSKSPDLALYQALMRSRTVAMGILYRNIQKPGQDMASVQVARFYGVDTSNSLAMQAAAANVASSVMLEDQGDGIIKVSFVSTDPYLAPQITDMLIEVTQRELNRIRTERLMTILEQCQKTADVSRQRYSQASGSLAVFRDANIAMEQSGRLQGRLAELESELKVREDEYQTARQRVDQMRRELDQLYPPVVVFDPASRPAALIGPNRRSKVMMGGFVGLAVGIVLILSWEFLLRKRRT